MIELAIRVIIPQEDIDTNVDAARLEARATHDTVRISDAGRREFHFRG
jgi:hypothetical protein